MLVGRGLCSPRCLTMDPRQKRFERRTPRMPCGVDEKMRLHPYGLVQAKNRLEFPVGQVETCICCTLERDPEALCCCIQRHLGSIEPKCEALGCTQPCEHRKPV